MKKNNILLALSLILGTVSIINACDKDDKGNSESDNNHTCNFPISKAIKSIPRPTLGMRWVLIDELSDEFNGTKLDDKKWYDYHPSWQGRPPGLFMSEQVSVKDGCLVLEGGKLEAGETVTVKTGYEGNVGTRTHIAVDKFKEGMTGYNVKCAAVVAKSLTAHYDTYYECKVKANKTLLSTTFWLSQHGKQVNAEGKQPSAVWNGGSFGQELDFLECIGHGGNFTGSFFSKGMHSNAHFWYKEGGVGPTIDFRAKESTLHRTDNKLPSDDFNVYGCWWVNESQAKFYLNNSQSNTMDFNVKVNPTNESKYNGVEFAFTEKMGMNLVMETYTWFYETKPGSSAWGDRIQNSDGTYNLVLPTDEELNDPTKNKNYYDWVRCYKLKEDTFAVDDALEYVMFENHISMYEKPKVLISKNNKFIIKLEYTASKNSEIEFALYDLESKKLQSQVETVYAGYGNSSFSFDIAGADLDKGKNYYMVVSLRAKNSKNSDSAYETDSFKFRY